MLKQIICKILSSSIATTVGKIILVSTVGITTVTTSEYIN